MSIYNLRFEDELAAAVDSELICNEEYCPFYMNHMSSPWRPCCEGEFCEQAFINYLEDQV